MRDSVVRHRVRFAVTSFCLSRVLENRSFQRHPPLFSSSSFFQKTSPSLSPSQSSSSSFFPLVFSSPSTSFHFHLSYPSPYSLFQLFAILDTFISRVTSSYLPLPLSLLLVTFLLSLACKKLVVQAPSKNSYPESR